MPLTIGQVAERSGIGIETVRFYERKGLVEEPPRADSGYRQYPEDVVARIRFIRRAKELGFKLSEISQLLSLRVDPDTTCADVKNQTELKIADVEEKIRVLQGIKTALKKLAASCVGTGPTSECPILESLDSQDEGLVRKESLRHEDETTNRSF
ncbi:MAG: MerR family transcriptional regulator [Acidobacteria bacterium]|nr:MAG: MerR family transcriptional regulator [Acidobacteriota bacterium]